MDRLVLRSDSRAGTTWKLGSTSTALIAELACDLYHATRKLSSRVKQSNLLEYSPIRPVYKYATR